MKLAALPVIGRRLQRRVARANYFACGARCGRTLDRLESSKSAQSPTQRARILTTYALLESDLGRHNAAGWNPDAIRSGKTNRYLTSMHEATAELVHLIASTEVAAGRHDRAHGPAEWEEAFGYLLSQLAEEDNVAIRSNLMHRMYLAAYPVVGGDVAEVLATLRGSYTRLALNQPATFAATTDGSTS